VLKFPFVSQEHHPDRTPGPLFSLHTFVASSSPTTLGPAELVAEGRPCGGGGGGPGGGGRGGGRAAAHPADLRHREAFGVQVSNRILLLAVLSEVRSQQASAVSIGVDWNCGCGDEILQGFF